MNGPINAISERSAPNQAEVFAQLARQNTPVVLRGLTADWPLVRAGRESTATASEYLLAHYNGQPVTAFVAEENIDGRLFYTDSLRETNFKQIRTDLEWVLEQISDRGTVASPSTVYMGSTALDYCLPGISETNSLPAADIQPSVRIWIGNRSRVAAHFDVMNNVACVCAGRRRFTLFPPDQLANLYVGPLDVTPAGQQVSLVDLKNPDFDTHPRFREALKHAQVAELLPGDAIFIPGMWWHHVEGLEDFNILINHWWLDVPAHMGAPADALLHAILNIRDLPEAHRAAWREIFDHYVFAPSPESLAHIPEASRGVLGPLDAASARQLRALLRNKLNR